MASIFASCQLGATSQVHQASRGWCIWRLDLVSSSGGVWILCALSLAVVETINMGVAQGFLQLCHFFLFVFIFIFFMCIGSHLLRVLWPLCSTGCVVQSYDGLVAHGANTANLQPFQQAPEKNSMRISQLNENHLYIFGFFFFWKKTFIQNYSSLYGAFPSFNLTVFRQATCNLMRYVQNQTKAQQWLAGSPQN